MGAKVRSASMGAVAVLVAAGLLLSSGAQAPVAGPDVEDTSRSSSIRSAVDEARECRAEGKVPATSMSPERIDRRLDQLHERFDGMPGFVDVYFYAGLDPAFRPTFEKTVPPQAHGVETPVPVAFNTMPSRPVQAGPADDGNGPLPSQEDVQCTGIRPGARLTTGCTVNFIYTDGEDYYIGTAGHCISEGQGAALNGVGSVGTAVFSTGDGGVGNDFALIKIHDYMESEIDPEMCTFGGPTGTHTGSLLGSGVLQTGHGSVVGFPTFGLIPPRGRPGAGFGWGAQSFTWIGTSIPGDSGGPARDTQGEVLGTVTHLSLVAPVLNFGTTWDHGLEMAQADADVPDDLELVTGAERHPI